MYLKFYKVLWLIFGLIISNFGYTGINDLIYRNSFELSEVECPLATDMTDTGTAYQGSGTLNPVSSIHYYKLPTQNGEWLYISSASGVSVDTYLTLYTADGSKVLAENDNNELDNSTDSLLIYRNLEETTLCIKVQDTSTVSPNQVEGGDYDYIIQVNVLDLNNTSLNDEVEPNDTTATAQTGLSTRVYDGNDQEAAMIFADYHDTADIDTFQVTTPINAVAAEVQIMQNRTTAFGGTEANGGTTRALTLKVYDSNGSDVYAEVRPSNNVNKIFMPVQPQTDYYIQIDRPQSPMGDNPFNVLFWKTLSQQNQQEGVANNNSWDLAEIPSSFPNGNATSYFIGGALSGNSDVDWWRFEANAGDTVNLFCSSWHIGSGVRNFSASIYDNPVSSALQTGGESQLIGLAWYDSPEATAPAVNVNNTGFHYLRVSADTFNANVTGRFYQCGIHVISP